MGKHINIITCGIYNLYEVQPKNDNISVTFYTCSNQFYNPANIEAILQLLVHTVFHTWYDIDLV